jgi:hypothetical protein
MAKMNNGCLTKIKSFCLYVGTYTILSLYSLKIHAGGKGIKIDHTRNNNLPNEDINFDEKLGLKALYKYSHKPFLEEEILVLGLPDDDNLLNLPSYGISSHKSDVDIDTDTEIAEEDNDRMKSLLSKRQNIVTKANLKVGDTVNLSRYKRGRGNYVRRENYKSDNNYYKLQHNGFWNRVILAMEAKEILEAEDNSVTRDKTAVFCVALRNKQSYCKKFAFHSGEKAMGPNMFRTAENLGYDVIQAEQSHAEGQFLQFLRKRRGHYTHIMGMGCSKKHCAECDCLMSFLLGEGYSTFTAAVNDGKGKGAKTSKREMVFLKELTILNEDKEEKVNDKNIAAPNCEIYQARKLIFNVVIDRDAIDKEIYDNYYLPEKLQEWIQSCAKKELVFSISRFTKKESEDVDASQVINRKRLRSKSKH